MCKRTSLLSHACATLYATLCAVCQDVVMFSSTHSACVRLTVVEGGRVHARDGSSSRPTHGKKPTHRDSRVCCRVLHSRYSSACGSARNRRHCHCHCRRAVGALHERSARRRVRNTLQVSTSGWHRRGRVWSSVRTARVPTAAHEPPKHPEGLCRCGCVLSVAGLTSGLTSLRRTAAAQLQSQRYLLSARRE